MAKAVLDLEGLEAGNVTLLAGSAAGFVVAKAVLDLEGLEAGNVTLLAGSAVDLL